MTTIKALVVDDEADIVELLKDWLEMDGYEVYGTTDPKEALDIFFRINPDVSIVDLRMPEMDGFQLILAMRRESDSPIIILSGFMDADNIMWGTQAGADAYLTKPISKRLFLNQVAGVLYRSQNALVHCSSTLLR